MIVRSRSEKAEKMRRELDAATLDIHQKQARIRMLEDLEKNMEGYSAPLKRSCAKQSAERCAESTALCPS